MDTQRIENLIEVLESSGAAELEVQTSDSYVKMVKGKAPKIKKSAAVKSSPKEQVSVESTTPNETFITAPVVGIFHAGDKPVNIGVEINVGQVVGTIESMKVHNELFSRVSGTIIESLVEEGTPVEYGQPLFRVEIK